MPPVSRRCAADVLPGHRRLRARLWSARAPACGRSGPGWTFGSPALPVPVLAGTVSGDAGRHRVAFVGRRWRPGRLADLRCRSWARCSPARAGSGTAGPGGDRPGGRGWHRCRSHGCGYRWACWGWRAGRMVTAEALVDGLWGEESSPGREQNLHALVYQLRRRLAALNPERATRGAAGKGRARLPAGPRSRGAGRGRVPRPGSPGSGGGAGRGHRRGAGAVRTGAGGVAGGGAGGCGAVVCAAGRGGGPARGAAACRS